MAAVEYIIIILLQLLITGLSPQVIVHEFGHAFGGLGDEYYSG